MKPLRWLLFIFLFAVSACSQQTSEGKHEVKVSVDQPSTPPATPEEMTEPVSAEDQAPVLPTVWKNTFSYFNDGGVEGKMLLGNTFELSLEGTPQLLRIFSESMLSPHGILSIRAEGTETELNIYYLKKVKGTGWDDFEPEALLFSLQNKEEKLITKWEALKPLYEEVADEGTFFAKE